MREVKKTKQKKWIENVFLMWFITLIIALVSLLAQQLLPVIFKKNEYMEMLMNQKASITIIVITLVICIGLAIVAQSKSTEIQGYVEKTYQKSVIRRLVTVLSAIFCVLLSLIVVASVICDVDKDKNMKAVSGSVANNIRARNEKNVEVYKMLVGKESDGKKHRFYKNNHLESIEANRKEDTTVDYVTT